MALPTLESYFPLTPLPDPHLVIGVAQINFGKDLGEVESVEHLRYEGEGETIFDCHPVQTPVVHHEAELTIRTRDKHSWSSSWRLGRAYEPIGHVLLDVSFHGCQFWC